MVQQNVAGAMHPGDVYGRMPSSYYQDGGGYGVPGTRKSVTDAENARKVEAARREERYHYQHRHDLRPPKDMEHMGVYVSRNPTEVRNSTKTPESRTPDFSRTNFSDNRTISQSVERLDSDVHEVNGRDDYKSDNVGYKSDKDQCEAKDEEDDDEGGFKGGGGAGSDYEKLRGGGQSDSGRGSTVYSSGKAKTERNIDTSPEPNTITGMLKHIQGSTLFILFVSI